MNVTIEFTGLIDRGDREKIMQLDVEDGSNVLEVLAALKFTPIQARYIIVMRGQELCQKYTTIQDGDHLMLGVPAGGG